jgi:hypothetical protein
VADRKLVLVEWEDSRRGEGWVRLDELESTITKCKSVGWIIAKDAVSLTLAGHIGENPDQCCGDLTIPCRAILKLVSLPLPKSRSLKGKRKCIVF